VVNLTDRITRKMGSAGTGHLSLAGHGRRCLTRGNQGSIHPLFAKAIYLTNGGRRVLILSADLLLMNRRLAEGFREELARRGTTLSREEVLFSATHTHGGFAGYADRWVEVPSLGFHRPEISEILIQSLADAAEQAIAHPQPACIAFDSVDLSDEKLVVNRIDPALPTNDWLDVFSLTSAETGQRLATGVIFSAHATCQPRQEERVTGDYPGELCQRVESMTGAPCLFLAGSVGSMGPADHGRPRSAWAGKQGTILSRHVLTLIDRMPSGSRELEMASASIKLHLPAPEIKLGPDWRLSPLAARALVPAETTLHAVRLGDRLFLSMPADYSGELAEQIRHEIDGVTTVVTSFGGDYVGYILPDRHADRPTYEARSASILGPQTESFFGDATHRLAQLLPPNGPTAPPASPIIIRTNIKRLSAN
jgi:hypothetical protein